MLELVDQIKAGVIMNIFITGASNAGKSHLAISALKELNKKSQEAYAYKYVHDYARFDLINQFKHPAFVLFILLVVTVICFKRCLFQSWIGNE